MPTIALDVLGAGFPVSLEVTAGTVLAAALICLARMTDVSLGTIRTLYTMRGRKAVATMIGAVEVSIFITAISGVLAAGSPSPLKMAGYVLGYTAGVWLGITIEGYIASGWSMLRIISREHGEELIDRLRADGEAVTRVEGAGRDGPVSILFIVLRRKRTRPVLALVREVAPRAFVTVESVGHAMGGTILRPSGFATPLRYLVRK